MRIRPILVLAGLSLTSGLLISAAATAAVDIGVSINIAPPELPVYEQPAVPGPGYLWSPGYWAWGDSDYYWVPGTWVLAPQPGYLWTPGYWGWGDGAYLWHGGYWGPHVGFYGGVNYGYGYGGHGYEGGEWRGGAFFYNRSVNNIPNNVRITNVYNRTVVNNVTVNRVSFNGGNGGIAAQASRGEVAAEHERHLAPVADQMHHEQAARANPALRATSNHGAPPIGATARPGAFSGPGVVGAHGAAPGAVHPGAVHPGPSQPGAAHTELAHPGPSQPRPAHTELAHPGPSQPGAAQPAVHQFKPPAQGGAPGSTGSGHTPPPPPPARTEHKAAPEHPPAEHGNPERGNPERGNPEHEH